jgi:hypothetical protein
VSPVILLPPTLTFACNIATLHSTVDTQCNHTVLTAEINWGIAIKKEQHVFLHPNTEITPWYQVDILPPHHPNTPIDYVHAVGM